jgi:hypothetical protein
MKNYSIRKKNGETVDIESEDTLSIAELMDLCSEPQESKPDTTGSALVDLVSHLKAQAEKPAPVAPALPVAPAAEPKADWRRAKVTITDWDKHGRIAGMDIEKF